MSNYGVSRTKPEICFTQFCLTWSNLENDKYYLFFSNSSCLKWPGHLIETLEYIHANYLGLMQSSDWHWVLEVEIPLVKLLYWPSVNFPCCTYTFWKNCKHTIIHTQFKVDSNIVQSSLVKTRFQKLFATHNNSNAKALEIKYIMHYGIFKLLFSYRKGLLISLVTLSCARK